MFLKNHPCRRKRLNKGGQNERKSASKERRKSHNLSNNPLNRDRRSTLRIFDSHNLLRVQKMNILTEFRLSIKWCLVRVLYRVTVVTYLLNPLGKPVTLWCSLTVVWSHNISKLFYQNYQFILMVCYNEREVIHNSTIFCLSTHAVICKATKIGRAI